MSSRSRILPWKLLAFQLTLLLLAGVGLLAQASSTQNEKKYVAAAYFEKHDSLIVSHFEDFISTELVPVDRVNGIAVRFSDLKRDLIGEGSHRQLSSSIQLDITELTQQTEQLREWEIVVLERLPSGVFADPFELQHLVSRGEFSAAAVFGDTNLELPSVASNRSLVELHLEIGHNVSSRRLEVSVKLPLHARYAPLADEKDGLSGRRMELEGPDVFIRRRFPSSKKVDDDDGRWCLYPLRVRGSNGNGDDEVWEHGSVVGWEVPRGMKSHTLFVSVTTFVVALVCAFITVLTSIRY